MLKVNGELLLVLSLLGLRKVRPPVQYEEPVVKILCPENQTGGEHDVQHLQLRLLWSSFLLLGNRSVLLLTRYQYWYVVPVA